MPRRHAAFTIMELMLAIALAVIALSLAIPILGSVFGEDPIQQNYQKFSEFVRQAQTRAISEKRTMLIIWHKEGLTIEPEIPKAEDIDAEPPKFAFGEAALDLHRPFSLEKRPLAEWPFWRSGACEPVQVTYESDQGKWVAEFDPLTAQGTIIEMHD